MTIALFLAISFAVLFYRAADHERLNPMIWSVASLGLTGIVTLSARELGVLLLAQAALFVVLWWYNVKRKGLDRGHIPP
jgi:hypothetical protein